MMKPAILERWHKRLSPGAKLTGSTWGFFKKYFSEYKEVPTRTNIAKRIKEYKKK